MKQGTDTVKREVKIEGIGQKEEQEKSYSFDICESMADVTAALPGKNSDEKTTRLVGVVNEWLKNQARAKAYASLGGTGRKSAISSAKRMITQLKNMNPALSDAEAAQFVLSAPGVRESLEKEGITIEEVSAAPEDESNEAAA